MWSKLFLLHLILNLSWCLKKRIGSRLEKVAPFHSPFFRIVRATESLQIAAQDNAVRTNHIKARIDKTQQNSKCRLCGDRDETINHIISECSKLAQKEYKARHNWVGKVIHREICKKFKFDHTSKWYMHKPAHVLENNTHKLLWDFNIQTDHLIPGRRPDLIIINKKREFAKLSTLLSRRITE